MEKLQFGIFADAQYCNYAPFNNRHFKKSLSKLRELVINFNEKQVAFAVNLGDLIDRDYESFEDTFDILKDLKSPIYHVFGESRLFCGK
ncbi:MAG: hypothetical protein HC842_07955 [Cytophagales bacterium]|nr:hypothetical protein [Cytophagales bacterium]